MVMQELINEMRRYCGNGCNIETICKLMEIKRLDMIANSLENIEDYLKELSKLSYCMEDVEYSCDKKFRVTGDVFDNRF